VVLGPDATLIDVPGMDPNTALTFTWSNASSPLLPAQHLGRIQPLSHKRRRSWTPSDHTWVAPSKVRVIHRGPPLRLPEVDDTIWTR